MKDKDIVNNFLMDFSLTLENEDIIFIKNLNYEYVYCNPVYEKFLEKMFGIKPEEIKGKTDFDIYPMSYAKECRESDVEALEKGCFVGYEIIDNEKYIIVKLKMRRDQLPNGGIVTLAKLDKKGENNSD